MSDYTKSTNFAAKDALASGNAAKVVKGTEIDTEFNNIATAIATKTDDSSAAITGGTIDGTAIGGTTPAAGAFTTLSASGVSSFADGTASAPAITNTGDINTGIFFPAADTIAFAEGGVEAMRLDSSGNMGLGVTPSTWFSANKAIQFGSTGAVSNYTSGSNIQTFLSNNVFWNAAGTISYLTTNTATSYTQDNGTHKWYYAASGTAGNAITFTQAMTLDASGNLFLGQTSQGNSEKFGITSANAGAAIRAVCTSTTGFAGQLDCTSASLASSSQVLYIQTSGITLNNSTAGFWYCNDSTALRGAFRTNGGLSNYQANNTNLSDRREKTNFAPAGDYLSKICAIPVQTFNYIDQNLEQDEGLTLGVVAQDVQAVAPELVTESNWGTEEDPKMRLSIYQTDLQYALMKCIQEQQAIIEQLTNRITALEAK